MSKIKCLEGPDKSFRFLPPSFAEKYDVDMPDYQGVDQIVEVSGGQHKM